MPTFIHDLFAIVPESQDDLSDSSYYIDIAEMLLDNLKACKNKVPAHLTHTYKYCCNELQKIIDDPTIDTNFRLPIGEIGHDGHNSTVLVFYNERASHIIEKYVADQYYEEIDYCDIAALVRAEILLHTLTYDRITPLEWGNPKCSRGRARELSPNLFFVPKLMLNGDGKLERVFDIMENI